jgi:hypothetical protein
MNRKIMATMKLVFVFAIAAAISAMSAAATPTSPGACNMLHVSPQGMDGMLKASPQGLGNMMSLVIASEAAGCRP